MGTLWGCFHGNYTISHGNVFIQSWLNNEINNFFQLFPTSVDKWTLKKVLHEHCFLPVRAFGKWSISNSTSPFAFNIQRTVLFCCVSVDMTDNEMTYII